MKSARAETQAGEILCIEDNIALVAAIGALVRDRIVAVNTLAQAWEAIRRKHAWHVVLLDLALPDSTLEDTVKSIRRLRESFVGRLVVMTGHAVDAQDVISRGADVVLSKADDDFTDKLVTAIS